MYRIWRDYNYRSDMEKRIAERLWRKWLNRRSLKRAMLKCDLAADGFCLKEFFATEADFRAFLFLFNLLGEFQRVSGMPTHRQPATLRTQVFLCGAV
jgi:hypothetical protein